MIKEYPIIHEHTDLTYEDLKEFARDKAIFLADTSRDHYPTEGIGSKNHYYFNVIIDALQYDLIFFGYRSIDNGRMNLKRIRDNIWILKQLIKPEGHISALTNMKGIFESYYNCFKEALTLTECYEMIPILDKKYKAIIKIFDIEIRYAANPFIPDKAL